jgi:uncharacterized protein
MRKSSLQPKLETILDEIGSVAVAVSGGVDSMTLAHVAHKRLGCAATMFHALSPAVPDEATQRILAHSDENGWHLEMINANEMQDPRYLENPLNRCFFCKTNLYSRISNFTSKVIISGTNLDDLNDFRPGLEAAQNFRVRHPFVESAITKNEIRSIAFDLGLHDVSDLPAAPCLSSRIETGLRVTNEKLKLIDDVERLLKKELGPQTVRCRLKHSGVLVELEEDTLSTINHKLREKVDILLEIHGIEQSVNYALYRQGSAFIRD